jgi:methyltransferase (TIGR00027 family)
VKDRQASATALLIAASLVLAEKNPAYAGTVSTASAELAAGVLKNYSRASRYLLRLLPLPWFWQVAALCQQLTIPGIVRHYALRKKCIAQLACQAIADGISQIVVLGAGFDGLAIELRGKFADVRLWEVDHPATQRYKAAVLNSPETRGIHFVSTDLSLAGLDEESLISARFDREQRALWIAEGVLMYFSEPSVVRLLEQVQRLSAPSSRLIFTFMERDARGRIRFRNQTRLVDWWLRRGGEPFQWGAERAELTEFISPWRLRGIYDDNDLRKMDPAHGKKTLAAGELICLADS